MTSLTADSIAELFSGAVTLAKSGEKISPRGMATHEVRDVHLLLTQPRARLLYAPPARIVNPAFAVAETVWHLSGSDAAWIFDYNNRLRQFADEGVLLGAYGPRMRNWAGKVDQLARVVEILQADPDSRRALIQLYDPAQDAAGHKDVPCTLGFRFHLRAGRLHMATMMRGQDVWIGMPYDVFFYTVLHELVAGWLDAELASFTCTSARCTSTTSTSSRPPAPQGPGSHHPEAGRGHAAARPGLPRGWHRPRPVHRQRLHRGRGPRAGPPLRGRRAVRALRGRRRGAAAGRTDEGRLRAGGTGGMTVRAERPGPAARRRQRGGWCID
jgi:hypothetical protein